MSSEVKVKKPDGQRGTKIHTEPQTRSLGVRSHMISNSSKKKKDKKVGEKGNKTKRKQKLREVGTSSSIR